MDCLAAEVFFSFSAAVAFSGTVFVTLFGTVVGRVISLAHKLLCTGEVSTSVTFKILAVADGLFGLYVLERRDELLIGTRSPCHPLSLITICSVYGCETT